MELIQKIILKKGFVNMSDFQMVQFELEMKNKEIDYHNKRLTLTPITDKSRYHYMDQMERIDNDEHHVWTDCKQNCSEKGDYFGYVENPNKINETGKIKIYKILEVMEQKYSLKYWNNKDRNVLLLSSKNIYEGSAKELFNMLKYSDKYKQQNTMRINKKNQEKLNNYYSLIFNR